MVAGLRKVRRNPSSAAGDHEDSGVDELAYDGNLDDLPRGRGGDHAPPPPSLWIPGQRPPVPLEGVDFTVLIEAPDRFGRSCEGGIVLIHDDLSY